IRIKAKFEQGEDVFRKRRSLFFKKMQIVRGCDVKRNVLVYMVYSDRLIEGSPKNSTSTVPIMPWGASDQVQRCARTSSSTSSFCAVGEPAAARGCEHDRDKRRPLSAEIKPAWTEQARKPYPGRLAIRRNLI